MRRAASFLALIGIGLIVPLALIEIGLRLFAPQPLAVNVSAWDPHYGWRNRPGTHGFFRTSEYRMEVSIDSLGLRDREMSRAKPPGTWRILGLGDSFAFGHGVAADSCFLKVAERFVDHRSRAAGGPRVEVLNSGVGKWATAQEYLYLEHEGYSFQPDAVVLAFCDDNDGEGNMEEGVLRVRDGRLEPVAAPEPAVRTLQRVSQAVPGYAWLAEHSHLVNWIRVRVSVLETNREAKRLAAEAAARGGAPRAVRGVGTTTGPATPALDPAPTFRIVDALVESTRRHHVPLLVLFIPGLGQCPPPDWKPSRPYPDPRPHETLVATLTAHLDSLGVPLVNPIDELREANRTALQYFPIDFHLNERGSRLVGRALARGLMDGGCVPPAIRTGP
ncbi:MAG: SGNH/GDSL hydrolase family protein [Candidatus Eisenbacteria bacterium]|nr:SGNH/GDSL hydrolase family protein [Candidatus Eisenbacteria bacterium]